MQDYPELSAWDWRPSGSGFKMSKSHGCLFKTGKRPPRRREQSVGGRLCGKSVPAFETKATGTEREHDNFPAPADRKSAHGKQKGTQRFDRGHGNAFFRPREQKEIPPVRQSVSWGRALENQGRLEKKGRRERHLLIVSSYVNRPRFMENVLRFLSCAPSEEKTPCRLLCRSTGAEVSD